MLSQTNLISRLRKYIELTERKLSIIQAAYRILEPSHPTFKAPGFIDFDTRAKITSKEFITNQIDRIEMDLNTLNSPPEHCNTPEYYDFFKQNLVGGLMVLRSTILSYFPTETIDEAAGSSGGASGAANTSTELVDGVEGVDTLAAPTTPKPGGELNFSDSSDWWASYF